MGTGNAFFTDAERKEFRDLEGDWERNHPDEPPRLNDPPEADRVCGDCEYFGVDGCRMFKRTASPDDEACFVRQLKHNKVRAVAAKAVAAGRLVFPEVCDHCNREKKEEGEK